MIWRMGIDESVFVEVEDGQDDRPTPEYAEDMLVRMRRQMVEAHKEMAAYDAALAETLQVEDTWGGETIGD